MGLFVPTILLLVKFCFIGFVQRSAGFSICPSPATDLNIPTIGVFSPVYQERPVDSIAPTSSSKTHGSNSNTPDSLPPLISAPVPQTSAGLVPSHFPSVPVITPPSNATASPPLISQEREPSSSPGIPFFPSSDNGASPPLFDQEQLPPTLPDNPGRHELIGKPPISLSDLAPAAPPMQSSLPNSSVIHPSTPENSPPTSIPPSTPLQISPPHISLSSPPNSSPSTPENSPLSAIPPSTPLQSSPPRSSPSTLENSPPSAIPPSTPLQSSPPHSPPSTPENSPPSAIPPLTPLQSSPPYSSVTHPSAPENSPPNTIPPSTPFLSSPPHPSITHPSTPENSPPSTVSPSTPMQGSPPHPSVIRPSPPENSPPSTVPLSPPVPSSPPRSTITHPSPPEHSPTSTVPPPPSMLSSPPRSPITHPSPPENSPPSTVPPSPSMPSSPPHSPITHPSPPENSPPNTVTSSPPIPSQPPHSPITHPSPPANLSPSTIPPSPPMAGSPPRLPVTHPSPENSPSNAHHRNGLTAPSPARFVHGPIVSPTREYPKNKRQDHHIKHEESPSTGPVVAPVPYPRFPPNEGYQTPPFPSPTFIKRNRERREINVHAPVPAYTISPPSEKGLVIPPSILPDRSHSYHVPRHPSPGSPVSTSPRPYPKPVSNNLTAPSPSTESTSSWNQVPVLSPKASPSQPSIRCPPKMPPLLPLQALPPPPPNEDCLSTVCAEPFTNTPPGSPCGCVLPMQVGLSVNVALYTFFPLVSRFAQEIAAGVFMKLSQVRIMGAYAASQEPEKTIVLIDLVPLGEKFNTTTAFVTYRRFWHKEVFINPTFFTDYEVLYVRYPGLPQSPPLPPSAISIIGNVPYPGNENNGRTIKPLGVDISRKHHKDGLSGGVIAVMTLSVVGAVVICSTVAWLLISRHRNHVSESVLSLQPRRLSTTKPSGTTESMIGSGVSSPSLSFESSIAPYTGSTRTFNLAEIERATNNFDASRILGEGGFGRVYSGVLDNGTEVAIKVLKRDDRQGGREFLAEVEMLSRLHHRNLVRLIGICVDEHARCLVYELVPNGNVESYLHGVQKDSTPLDWDARIKIALGAARGLAYLHEDSSPRVIHRDFKSSNILLELDFTPKVSDFGLARTALDEENRHISTRVMGTFGYVAPEYAMTGHLLVKSDVYSYGVVLLELLTGRKPVDMTRPPGQENLVAWACPLLTSREGLQMIIDPTLGHDVPFDSVAKVAAIASMCVQPEVSNRPFMGEVVQALKLVCNECDEAKEIGSRTSSLELSSDFDDQVSVGSVNHTYDSEPDIERGLPISDFYRTSVLHGGAATASFRRCSSSGPSSTGKTKQLWLRMKELTGGSLSEYGIIYRQWSGSH